MPITATDTSREQITLPIFNVFAVLVAMAGLMLFGDARWQIVKASADMLPVNRAWRLVVEAAPSGTTVRAEIDLPIEVALAERGGR